jgi:hypothetical protein
MKRDADAFNSDSSWPKSIKSKERQMGMISKIIIYVIIFWSISITASAGELDKPYSPTRKEWLEISIFKLIKVKTDAWKQRIGFLVWVKEEENTVYITLTSANGEEPLSPDSENTYVKTIKGDVQSFLQQYGWAKNLKVFVGYT